MNQEQVVNTRINSIFGFSEENAHVTHDTEVLLCSCWFSSDFDEQYSDNDVCLCKHCYLKALLL